MKIKIKNLSTKAKILLLSGSLILVGGVGYSFGKNTNEKSEKDNNITTEEEFETETVVNETTVSDNQVYYDEITELEENVIDFCEVSLPNGFIEVNESNNDEMAELFTNAYIQMNNDTLKTKTLAILNQDLELIPSEISRDFMEFSTSIARYYQIATPETELPFDKLIKDKDDLEFITSLSSKIAEMNACIDSELRQEKINKIIEIKESLLTNPEIVENYSSETLYLATKMIIYSDATAKSYGQEIITEEESEIQLYSAFYNIYCDKIVSSGYVEGTEVIDREISSQSAFESKYLSSSASILKDKIEIITAYDSQFDNYYSYNNVTERISEKMLGLYIKPEQNYIEQENEIREQVSNQIDQETIGESSVTIVPKEDVPESVKEPEKEVITDNTGNVVTEGYIEGLAAGRTAGSDAAWNMQTSTSSIPNTISSSQAPNPVGNKSSEYINGYKAGYSEGWNNYVASAKAAQSIPTIEYQPIENGNEEIIDETEPTNVPYEEKTEFIPIDEGEEIITISKLNDIKKYIVQTYGESYNIAQNEEKNKRM